MTATLKESLTVPSLAELRARKPIESTTLVFMTEAERDILLDIAEAAQAMDTALLHDAVAGVEAKLTLDDLGAALAKVRP